MFIHAGKNKNLRSASIVGIFDADSATVGKDTKKFLAGKQNEGKLITISDELPKAFVLCDDGKVYFTQLSVKTLTDRSENGIRQTRALPFSLFQLKFSPAFFKRRCRPPTAVVALRRARNLRSAFSF